MNAKQIKNRRKRDQKRALRKQIRSGHWHAYFSQEAFDKGLSGNYYRRPNGQLVLITLVVRVEIGRGWERENYLWKDTKYLGIVSEHVRTVRHILMEAKDILLRYGIMTK